MDRFRQNLRNPVIWLAVAAFVVVVAARQANTARDAETDKLAEAVIMNYALQIAVLPRDGIGTIGLLDSHLNSGEQFDDPELCRRAARAWTAANREAAVSVAMVATCVVQIYGLATLAVQPLAGDTRAGETNPERFDGIEWVDVVPVNSEPEKSVYDEVWDHDDGDIHHDRHDPQGLEFLLKQGAFEFLTKQRAVPPTTEASVSDDDVIYDAESDPKGPEIAQ